MEKEFIVALIITLLIMIPISISMIKEYQHQKVCEKVKICYYLENAVLSNIRIYIDCNTSIIPPETEIRIMEVCK